MIVAVVQAEASADAQICKIVVSRLDEMSDPIFYDLGDEVSPASYPYVPCPLLNVL